MGQYAVILKNSSDYESRYHTKTGKEDRSEDGACECAVAVAAVVARPLVDLADGRGVQLRDVELVGVEHPVEGAVEGRIGLQEGRKITLMSLLYLKIQIPGPDRDQKTRNKLLQPLQSREKRSQDSHSAERF